MENDTCHFTSVNNDPNLSLNLDPRLAVGKSRVGRPRRGTESARTDLLIAAATRVFLRDGYGSSSIDKVAAEAGVSTRTIYERFKNKGDLLGAVINRLVERDMETVLSTEELDRLEPRQALTMIGELITGRACNPDSAALFRICATEAYRFPELAARMRDSAKARVNDAIANYLRRQALRGTLSLGDPDRAAGLFLQMVCAELHERLLFGSVEDIANFDSDAHLKQVVDIFLNGTLPREGAGPSTIAPTVPSIPC
jgi:TetR/AcrR family transcriptional regulator, mexJK operon transcriptional repressor